MMHFSTTGIICAILYFILAPFAGGLLNGIDRKLTARMQGRKGPSILQPFYDVHKLIKKDVLRINNMQYIFVWGFLILVIITGVMFFAGADLLLVFFTLTTAAMFLVLEASTTNTPYSVLGSQREITQMLSYEPMVLITAVGFYMATGSFHVAKIITADIPAVVYLPGVFFGFLYILTIKLRKSPFDISTSHHAHQELVKGITTEISGKMLAVIEITHWYENVFLMGVIGLFIVHNAWWSIPLAILVIAIAYFIEILIDNTSARVKWDVMFKSSWIITIVAGVLNIVVLQILLPILK